MKYDVMVEGPGGRKHGFRLSFLGLLDLYRSIRGYGNILGPGLERLHPKVVSVTPQLALPYYPSC